MLQYVIIMLYCTLTLRQTAEQVLPLLKIVGSCSNLPLLLPSLRFSNFALYFAHGHGISVWSEIDRLNEMVSKRLITKDLPDSYTQLRIF